MGVTVGLEGESVRLLHRSRGRRRIMPTVRATVAEIVAAVEPGGDLWGVAISGWTLAQLVAGLLEKTGPADVVISTWCAASGQLMEARELLECGAIRSCRFLVDDSFETRQPAFSALLRHYFGEDCIRCTRNHSKFCTVVNDAWGLVVRGSMNLERFKQANWWAISESRELAAWLAAAADEFFHEPPGRDAMREEQRRQWFGDGIVDVDLRRIGVTRRC